jgi:hypothetical protein
MTPSTFAPNTPPSATRASFWLALVLAVAASVATALLRYYPVVWNLAPVGALALFAGARLRSPGWLLLPLGLLVATDYWLSLAKPDFPFLYPETPFVYGTYILIFVLGQLFGQTENPWRLTGLSFLGTVVFFLITNFGSWLNVAVLHTVVPYPGLNDYTPDLAGLLLCYERALPFYRGTLAGDLSFSLVLFGAHALGMRLLFQPERQGEAVS